MYDFGIKFFIFLFFAVLEIFIILYLHNLNLRYTFPSTTGQKSTISKNFMVAQHYLVIDWPHQNKGNVSL